MSWELRWLEATVAGVREHLASFRPPLRRDLFVQRLPTVIPAIGLDGHPFGPGQFDPRVSERRWPNHMLELPLMAAFRKIASTLAASDTVARKPAEQTLLHAIQLNHRLRDWEPDR